MLVLGKLVWLREESLASILSAELVDLPVSPIMARMDDEFGSQTRKYITYTLQAYHLNVGA